MKPGKSLIIIILFFNISFGQSDRKVVECIIQKSIDLKEVSQYFHDEVSGRVPLIILNNSKVLHDIKLYKFNKPVKILTEKEIKKQNVKAYLEFKYILTEKETASVSFMYNIEGMVAKIDFIEKNGKWEVSNIEVVEK